jgi:hypothetical protein
MKEMFIEVVKSLKKVVIAFFIEIRLCFIRTKK